MLRGRIWDPHSDLWHYNLASLGLLLIHIVTDLDFRRLDPCGLRLLYVKRKLSKPRTPKGRLRNQESNKRNLERKSLENALCIQNLDAYK